MKVFAIRFSPTGGTRKVTDLLAAAWGETVETIDLTDSRADFSAAALTAEDVALIAVPSYGGRVPATAAERLARVQGNGARAVLVCVYGNRAFEDTLVELEDVARAAGFRVVAAVAAIAEHSIAREVAAGRPDDADAACLAGFAAQIRDKLASGQDTEPAIPGNRPYKKAGGSGMVPKPTRDCVQCGVCAAQCPVQAIDPADVRKVNADACISCMRCVAVCPHGARKLNSVMQTAASAMLKKVCAGRKEPALYL